MKKNIAWDLILEYLEENCSDADKKTVLDWMNESDENRKEIELLQQIWNSADYHLPEPDVEKALENVKSKISSQAKQNINEQADILTLPSDGNKNLLKKFIFSPGFGKAAAVLISIAGIYFLLTLLTGPSYKEILVENKAQKNITLPDGTLVMLDAASSFRYPEKFEDEYREVYLNGEAFFDVISDQQTPFIVHANEGKITVLGTQFNVRAWKESELIIVSVVEGKVLFQSESSNLDRNKVVISKNKMSLLDVNGVPSSPAFVDVDSYLSWINREIYFKSVPLSEVLAQLERWYDLEFILPDNSYDEKSVSIYIENKPVDDILDVISIMMNFKYKQNGNIVTFSPMDQ